MLQKYNHSFLYTTSPYAKLPKMRGGAAIYSFEAIIDIPLFIIILSTLTDK